MENDQYFNLKDFSAYVEAQGKVAEAFENESQWSKKSLINIAKSGYFSSDRTIQEYADDIWNIRRISKKLKKIKNSRNEDALRLFLYHITNK